jgi:hypothetical protein
MDLIGNGIRNIPACSTVPSITLEGKRIFVGVKRKQALKLCISSLSNIKGRTWVKSVDDNHRGQSHRK